MGYASLFRFQARHLYRRSPASKTKRCITTSYASGTGEQQSLALVALGAGALPTGYGATSHWNRYRDLTLGMVVANDGSDHDDAANRYGIQQLEPMRDRTIA